MQLTFDQGLILLLLGVIVGGGLENKRKRFLEDRKKEMRRAIYEQRKEWEEGDEDKRSDGA